MVQGTLYALDNLALELHAKEPRREELDHLLLELSWVRMPAAHNSKTDLHLFVSSNKRKFRIPRSCREALRTDDFLGFEVNDDFYLTDRSSVFHLRPAKGAGYAHLAPSFFDKSELARGNFWCFGLLKLLRRLGIYSLHAAGLATKDGEGVLLVGPSGSGKSTLAIGLIREGWQYLSDDAVLLRHGTQRVEALACRRSFYVDAVRSSKYSDLLLGEEVPDSNGGRRRKLSIEATYPGEHISRCIPRLVIFPQIKRFGRSTLKLMDPICALRVLLAQSAPQLFDRSTMISQLEMLKRVIQQTETYELNAGRDLYREPAKLVVLIKEVQGRKNWRGSSSS